MGNSSRKRHKDSDSYFMDSRRNFGSPSGQLVNREPITPDLFMKIGTRVGTITAFYRHIPPVSNLKYPSNSSTVPCVSVPSIQLPTVSKTPEVETVLPINEQPVYDVPRSMK